MNLSTPFDQHDHPDIIVSIISHNSARQLRSCLKSIPSSIRHLVCQLWVVDNTCVDGVGQMLRREFPHVHLIENDSERGYGANHNQVIELLPSDVSYVLILNPDTIISHDAVGRLVDAMQENPDVAACGPALVDADGRIEPRRDAAGQTWRALAFLLLYVSNHRARTSRNNEKKRDSESARRDADCHQLPLRPPSSPVRYLPVDAISGACMLMRMTAVRQVGGFDERYFMYFEEIDWCMCVRRAGWKVLYLPDIQVLHEGGGSTRSDYLRYLIVYAESFIKFAAKHRGLVLATTYASIIALVALCNAARWSVLGRVRPERRVELATWTAFSWRLISVVFGALRP